MIQHDEADILPALSTQHDQVVELHQLEAEALLHSVKFRLRYLVAKAAREPMYPEEAQSIRPLSRLLVRLAKMLAGSWPRDRLHRPRVRRFKFDFDSLLLLNALLRDGYSLFAMEDRHEGPLIALYMKINQKAQNLTQFFQL